MPAAIIARWVHGGKKVKAVEFNPFYQQKLSIEAKREIPVHSARLFTQLLEQGQIPMWSQQFVDLDKIQRAAADV